MASGESVAALPPARQLTSAQSLLTDESMGNKASRLSFVNESCYSWDTYTDILRQGLLDHVPAFKVLRDRKADVASGLFNTPEWKGEECSMCALRTPIA